MKILIIAPQPFFAIRGTPLAIRELAGVLCKNGHCVDVLTFHLGNDIDLPGLHIYRNTVFSKLISGVPPGFSFKKIILDLAIFPKALLFILKNKYDVVHCVEESAFFVAWIKWIRKFLFIYDMDSDIPKQLKESGKIKNAFILGLAKKMEKFAVRRSDAVITICPVFTDKIHEYFHDKQVFQIEDVSVAEDISEEIALSDKEIILYTGNFEKYQGVELLIDAFKRIEREFPQAKLLIVGGEENEISGLNAKHGGRNIIFSGKRPISEMKKFLETADIVVSPRLHGENTPFKIYSYLASGKAILATNIVSHTQILTNNKNALLVDASVNGLAEGLKKLLSDDNLAQRLGSEARELFSNKYTKKCYDQKVGSYIKFLEENLCKMKK